MKTLTPFTFITGATVRRKVLEQVQRCPGWEPLASSPSLHMLAVYDLARAGLITWKPSLGGYEATQPAQPAQASSCPAGCEPSSDCWGCWGE